MTNEEKRINKHDLNSYKMKDNNSNLEAMIPGIHNLQTVGSSPLKRGAKNILNPYGTLNGSASLNNSINNSYSVRVLPTFTNEIKEDIIRRKEADTQPDKYNPITNPIPNTIQNPYVKKERFNIRNRS
jgi:hypothetical protein